MEYLHVHRITHRDLKPKNILLKTSDIDRRGFTAKVGVIHPELGVSKHLDADYLPVLLVCQQRRTTSSPSAHPTAAL